MQGATKAMAMLRASSEWIFEFFKFTYSFSFLYALIITFFCCRFLSREQKKLRKKRNLLLHFHVSCYILTFTVYSLFRSHFIRAPSSAVTSCVFLYRCFAFIVIGSVSMSAYFILSPESNKTFLFPTLVASSYFAMNFFLCWIACVLVYASPHITDSVRSLWHLIFVFVSFLMFDIIKYLCNGKRDSYVSTPMST